MCATCTRDSAHNFLDSLCLISHLIFINYVTLNFHNSNYSFYFIDHLIHFYKNQPNEKSFNILFNSEQINNEQKFKYNPL